MNQFQTILLLTSLLILLTTSSSSSSSLPDCGSSSLCCQAAASISGGGFQGSQISIMTAISYFESSWGPGRGPNTNRDGSKDYGLLQINSYLFCCESGRNDDCCCPGTSPKCSSDPSLRNCSCPCGVSCASILKDDLANSKCATIVYGQGGYGQWVAYRNHKGDCDGYNVLSGSCSPGCCGTWYGRGYKCCDSEPKSGEWGCCAPNYSECCPNTNFCCATGFPVCCSTFCCKAGTRCCDSSCCSTNTTIIHELGEISYQRKLTIQ